MRILFVENRYKTKFWELVASELEKKGHEIFWIVQNHLFKPSFGKINILPYPKKIENKKYDDDIKRIIQSDRGINYFGIKTDDHLFWYKKEIDKIIDLVNPNLVFGEGTLFHELLVIDSCKVRDILYLQPTSCRYPQRRFSFYKYNTLQPFGKSDQYISDIEIKEIINSIVNRTVAPDYMGTPKYTPSKGKLLQDKIKLTLGYLLGEKYNTPSPLKKIKINKHFQKNINNWEEIAKDKNEIDLKSYFNILYPLQMQPEANIDVWGYPNNNQAKVIERILSEIKDNEKIILKANPKSKYEISNEMLNLVRLNPEKIIILKHSTKMSDIIDEMDLVVTVTGTISIECILANKPIIMLGEALQTKQKNCIRLENNSHYRPILDLIKRNNFPKLTEEEKINYLKEIIETSFIGIDGDGLFGRHYLEDKNNMDYIYYAFNQITKSVERTI